jgi:hypothetical protein
MHAMHMPSLALLTTAVLLPRLEAGGVGSIPAIPDVKRPFFPLQAIRNESKSFCICIFIEVWGGHICTNQPMVFLRVYLQAFTPFSFRFFSVNRLLAGAFLPWGPTST